MARLACVLIVLLAFVLAPGATRPRKVAPGHAGKRHETASLRLPGAPGSWALRLKDGAGPYMPDALLAAATCPRCPLQPCRDTIALRPVPCRSTGAFVLQFSRPPPAI